MEENKNPKPLSKSLKRFFGVGDFSFTLMSNIDTYYASYFFTNIAKFSLGVVSVMTTISAVIDMILSSLYGPWMNKIKPKKWGRYRSWLILTPWIVPILYAMQFVRLGNGIAAVIFVTLAMITSRIAWNLPYIANVAMINIAGKTPEDRMALSSSRMVWTSLGSVAYSYVGPAVVSIFAGLLGEQYSYAATAFAFAALMAATYYAHFRMFKGYEPTGEEEMAMMAAEAEKKADEGQPAKQFSAVKAISCNPHLIALFGSCMMKYILLFLVNGMAVYYFTYVSQNAGLLAPFLLVANLLAVVASYLSKYIVGALGAKNTNVGGYLIMAAAGILSFVLYKNTIIVIIGMAIVLFIMNLTCACDPELFANCAAYSGEKLGADVTGTVMGLLTVPIKIGIVFRGILISACLALAGFDSSAEAVDATVRLQRGVSAGFMLIPAIVILLGALMLLFGYRLGTPKEQKA